MENHEIRVCVCVSMCALVYDSKNFVGKNSFEFVYVQRSHYSINNEWNRTERIFRNSEIFVQDYEIQCVEPSKRCTNKMQQ